jgi:hypothetical protein
MYGGQSFARVAPVTGGAMTDVRYYQERAGQAQSMDKVIGTTSAPSSAHQLTGFTPDGYAIWEKVSAPAPAPSGGGGGGGGGASPQQQQLVELSAASEKYRQESEAALKAAQAQIEQMKIQQQAPLIEAANMARGKQTASLQIQPSSTTPQTAGTQAFKRRRQPTEMPSIQSLGTLNVPTSSVLNV